MAVSLYEANFTMPVPHKELCTKTLLEEDISKLQEAIEDLYYFEFVFGTYIKSGTIAKGLVIFLFPLDLLQMTFQ